jgi:cysteine desulfuration protein SufE
MASMPTAMPPLAEVKEAFAFLEDWEDRYRYIMDLGERLPVLRDADRCEANLVHGCQSTVWLAMERQGDAVDIAADSDSKIVKGLAAVVVIALHGCSVDQIVHFDFGGLFGELQLHEHLSPTRSNGLHGMVQQVRSRAAELASG